MSDPTLCSAGANTRIGTICDFHGQCYTVTSKFNRTRRDGSEAVILVWEAPCATCGKPFTITTPAAAQKFQPKRRCQKHKRPGQRVKGTAL